MGRGRAKAKQTKVARELKYHSPNTDLAALQRELGGGEGYPGGPSDTDDFDDESVDDDDPDSDDDESDDEPGASEGGTWASRNR